jgi:hypothetical protein
MRYQKVPINMLKSKTVKAPTRYSNTNSHSLLIWMQNGTVTLEDFGSVLQN